MVGSWARWKELKKTLDLDDLDLGCVGMKAQVQIGGIVQCVDTERCGMSDIGEKKSPKLVGMPGSSNYMFPETAFLKRSMHHSHLSISICFNSYIRWIHLQMTQFYQMFHLCVCVLVCPWHWSQTGCGNYLLGLLEAAPLGFLL